MATVRNMSTAMLERYRREADPVREGVSGATSAVATRSYAPVTIERRAAIRCGHIRRCSRLLVSDPVERVREQVLVRHEAR